VATFSRKENPYPGIDARHRHWGNVGRIVNVGLLKPDRGKEKKEQSPLAHPGWRHLSDEGPDGNLWLGEVSARKGRRNKTEIPNSRQNEKETKKEKSLVRDRGEPLGTTSATYRNYTGGNLLA